MKIITEKTEFVPACDLREFGPEEEILFFDIETTGLKKETTQVYLIGCGYRKEGSWMLRQYLAEGALDEREVMEAFAEFAAGFRTLIHFNGEGFDIPYLAYKAEYYDLDLDFGSFVSVDLYKLAKPLKKVLGLARMNQKSIEGFLGIEREDRFGGGALIPVFYEFEGSGDPQAEKLLLLHNADDVRGMLQLTAILPYLGLSEGRFSYQGMEVAGDTAVLEYHLEESLPAVLERHAEKDRIRIFAEGECLRLYIGIYRGSARLPLPDKENYYYLPEEDRVIHKDVAQFVDRSKRKKATAKNCYLRKEGCFLPQKRKLFTPAFQVGEERKKTFFELTDSFPEDRKLAVEYALDILHL